MRFGVFIISVLFVCSLLTGISLAQNKVVIIPLLENEAVGDAESGDVLEGKTFSSDAGSDQIGTMPNWVKKDIAPGFDPQLIPKGYHDGTGQVSGDGNLVADNIKKDVVIFGVTGTSECISRTELDGYLMELCESECSEYMSGNTDHIGYERCTYGCQSYVWAMGNTGFECPPD